MNYKFSFFAKQSRCRLGIISTVLFIIIQLIYNHLLKYRPHIGWHCVAGRDWRTFPSAQREPFGSSPRCSPGWDCAVARRLHWVAAGRPRVALPREESFSSHSPRNLRAKSPCDYLPQIWFHRHVPEAE